MKEGAIITTNNDALIPILVQLVDSEKFGYGKVLSKVNCIVAARVSETEIKKMESDPNVCTIQRSKSIHGFDSASSNTP